MADIAWFVGGKKDDVELEIQVPLNTLSFASIAAPSPLAAYDVMRSPYVTHVYERAGTGWFKDEAGNRVWLYVPKANS